MDHEGKAPHPNEVDRLAAQLEAELVERFGVLLQNPQLFRTLGYRTAEAMRQALLRGGVPVPVMQFEGRRGRYALCKDVGRWLAEQRAKAIAARDAKPKRERKEVTKRRRQPTR
jgi:hypothetical protein